MISFSTFANILYCGMGGKGGKATFVRDLFRSITFCKTGDPTANLSDDMARKFFRGEREITSFAASIMPYVEPTCFANDIDAHCSESAAFVIQQKMAENQITLRMDSFADDIADVFHEILVEALASAAIPDDLHAYFATLTARCSWIKTLLHQNEPQSIRNFYIPNDIFDVDGKRKKATKILLESPKKYMVIQGTGGLGKSMLMRHLTLELIENYNKYHKIPVFVQLNEYDSKNMRLMDIIESNTKKVTNIHTKLEAGDCVILLDAMDEIKSTEFSNFSKELNRFADDYPDNLYIMSSRPVSNFMRFRNFTVYNLAPFTQKQAVAMIQKVQYRPERPSLKESFIQEIQDSLYETHQDFVENPLLLTIMLMTYERYAKIPSKRHVFYEEAFDTLATKHDAAKEGFDRVFETGMFPEEFSKVLQEFCARTYFAEKFELTDREFEDFFEQLDCIEEIGKSFTGKQLLTDFTDNLCIMTHDNGKICFIHRSFQEYFCAVYLSRDSDDKYPYMRQFFDSHSMRMTEDGAFEMLYDLEPRKMERLIYIPLLKDLYAKCREGETGYWDFLDAVYGEIYYNVGEVIDEYENIPKSYVYRVLLRKKGFERKRIYNLPLDEDSIIEQYFRVGNSVYTKIIYANQLDEWQHYQIIEECGYNCKVSVQDIRREQSALHNALKERDFAYYVEYVQMWRVLNEMEQRRMKSEKSSIYDSMFRK